MSASVDVAPGEATEAEQLATALAQAGVLFGMAEATCRELAESLCDPDFSVEGMLVAAGAPVVLGADGYFSPGFEPGIKPGHVSEDGKMDFRDRELLKAVKANCPASFIQRSPAARAGASTVRSCPSPRPVRQR